MKTIWTVLRSFRYATAGIVHFFQTDRNGRVELGCALLAVAFSWWLKVSAAEWLVVLLCCGAVLGAEMFNHAIEKLCDLVHPGQHPVIRVVKDVAAGATLLTCIVSVLAGLIIFLPRLMALLA